MHWLDFDGDACAIIPNDTPHGKIIVDAIRSFPYDIWEAGKTAIKKEFNHKNFINHLVDSAKRDRTGVITNHASRALDISNHLKAAVYFAKEHNCETITLLSPKVFGSEFGKFGSTFKRKIGDIQGSKSLLLKGFLEARYNPLKKCVEFIEPGHVGTFSLEQINEMADDYLGLVEMLRILQGREIDGAKTGVFAEGDNPAGNEFIDDVKVVITPHHMVARQRILKRDVSKTTLMNEFVSISPLGRAYNHICSKESDIMDYLDNGSNKIFLLHSLLTVQERTQLNQFLLKDGVKMSLIDYMIKNKKAYNLKVHDIINNSNDDTIDIMNNIKEFEISELTTLASVLGISLEVMAVAAYTATYTKNSGQNEGLTYGWLLFGELLSVFSRGNKKLELFRLPLHVEHAQIKNGALYVNDVKQGPVNAPDCDSLTIKVIEERPYALIRKHVDYIVSPEETVNHSYSESPYVIGAIGFKYHITDSNDPKETWKELVRKNNFVFDIVMDSSNRAVISIDGKSISALMNDASFDLCNKRVQCINHNKTNPLDESDGAIKNIWVKVIGNIQ